MNKISVFGTSWSSDVSEHWILTEKYGSAPPTLPPHSAMPIRGMPLQDTVNQ